MTRAITKIIKPIQIVKIINYVSIQSTYINFIKLYLTNFCKKKALNNLPYSVAICVTGTMEKSTNQKPVTTCRWFAGLLVFLVANYLLRILLKLS